MTDPLGREQAIAAACAAVGALGPCPADLAQGLAAGDAEALREAVRRRLDAGRREGLREILETLRDFAGFALWARVQAARLHRESGEFGLALAELDELTLRFPERAAPEWSIGRARCFLGLGRIGEAEAAAREAVARFAQSPAPLAFMATLYSELGDAPGARDALLTLTARHADTAPAQAWAALARAHHEAGDDPDGAAALAELERRFPDSALGERERLRLARERETGLGALRGAVEAALRRFPRDGPLRATHVQVLVALGRLDEAEAETAALEAEGDEAGFPARLRVEAYRGDWALLAFLARREALGPFAADEAQQAARALLDLRTPEAFARGGALVETARRNAPNQARLDHLAARFAIALRRDEAALALVEGIPGAYRNRETLELRAWAAARRGRHDEAKAIWAEATRRHVYPALHGPPARLTRLSPDDRPSPGEGVTAYVAFRNEAAHIGDFLRHHRRLGVRRFVFFDHASDDGGRALALGEPDVVLYDCPESFQLSACGRRWMGEVIAREGARGWGLQVDMDERLIYPGCETVSLDAFVAFLDAQGYEAVRGFMLDLYPRRLVEDAGGPPAFAEHRWWDESYFPFGVLRPPYLAMGGGVRARLFEAKEYLYKAPLWRLDAGALLNPHETTAMRFADVSAALLHYKLMNLTLRGAGATQGTAFLEADSDLEAVRSHSRYAERLARLWREDLYAPGLSRELEDSFALAARGLMEVSDAYRRFCQARTAP